MAERASYDKSASIVKSDGGFKIQYSSSNRLSPYSGSNPGSESPAVERARLLDPRRDSSERGMARSNSGYRLDRQRTEKILYLDFYPRFYESSKDIRNDSWPITSDFKSLIESVNKWLAENPGAEPMSCESITWSSDDVRNLVTPGDLMVASICLEENMPTFFLLGLRLWYALSSASSTVHRISVLEFIPMSTDSTVQDLVRQIDSDLKSDEILNLETQTLPLQSGFLNSELTSWKEVLDYTTTHAYFLRLFLVHGRETPEKDNPSYYSHLSIADFVPRLKADGEYEVFADLLERCNDWFNSSEVTIVNLQSVFSKQDPVQHENTGSACFYEKPGLNFCGSVDYFRILRVVYVTGNAWHCVENAENNNISKRRNRNEVPPILYEIFTPDIVMSPLGTAEGGLANRRHTPQRGPALEGMSQTFAKLAEFVSDCEIEVVNLEMVSNPVQFRSEECLPKSSLKFLFSIRLFFRYRKLRRESSTAPLSYERASALGARGPPKPGPIFLKNVVSRRFPYRWLILSVSAFSSMAIIVAISVVYSHK